MSLDADPSTTLTDASEAEWALLHDQFDLSDDFWLGFIFSVRHDAPRVMAARVALKLRGKGPRLRSWQVNDEHPWETVLHEVVSAARERTHDCLWIDALSLRDLAQWETFLMRANEQREVFEKNHYGALVLVAQAETKRAAQERSPDLWAFRAFVMELDVAPQPVAVSSTPVPEAEVPVSTTERFESLYVPALRDAAARAVRGEVDDARRALLRLLGSARDAQTPAAWVARAWGMLAACEDQQGDTVAAAAHYQQALKGADGVDREEVRVWLEALARLQEGHLELVAALRTWERLLEVERWRAADETTPIVLRDLLVALHQVGRLRVALGQLAGAEAIFTESVEVSRRLRTLQGEVLEAHRDLSICLDQVGKIRVALGQLSTAETVFRESLEIRRRLLTLRGENPEALRDLSVSLHQVGKLWVVLGRLADAEALFRESLEISRHLQTLRGEDPETLRDLSINLDQVGNLRVKLGQIADAEAVFGESLEIRRKLLTLRGEIPEALRDLSVTLEEIGKLCVVQGHLTKAESVFAESLAMRRRLLMLRGEVPEALRDLSISLDELGNLQMALGHLVEAESIFGESLEISRRLLTLCGDSPEAQRDLSIGLRNVGDLQVQLGRFAEAEPHLSESLEISRRLRTLRGEVPEALRDLILSLVLLGTLRLRRGQPDEAETLFREARPLAERLRVLAQSGVHVEPIPDIPAAP